LWPPEYETAFEPVHRDILT